MTTLWRNLPGFVLVGGLALSVGLLVADKLGPQRAQAQATPAATTLLDDDASFRKCLALAERAGESRRKALNTRGIIFHSPEISAYNSDALTDMFAFQLAGCAGNKHSQQQLLDAFVVLK